MGNKKKNICTLFFVVANIVVYILLGLKGNPYDPVFMVEHGASYTPFIIENGEYYRLFTSMFLHFGVEHLINNMIVLAAIGFHLEPHLGKVKFVLIYILSGLGANVLSLLADLASVSFPVSAGASGAVFGIMGALVVVVLKNKGRIEGIDKSRMIFMVILSVYLGFTSPGTDNMAHIAGLIIGALLCAILYRNNGRKSVNEL